MFILPPCRVCWASQRTSDVWRRARTSMMEEIKHWAAPTESRETSWWTAQRMEGCLKDDYPWCLIYDILFDTLPLSGPALCTHTHTHTGLIWQNQRAHFGPFPLAENAHKHWNWDLVLSPAPENPASLNHLCAWLSPPKRTERGWLHLSKWFVKVSIALF